MRQKSIQLSEGIEVQKLIDLVNASGLKTAARAYDTSAPTLSRWLRQNGFQVYTVWKLTPTGKEAVKSA